jgi:hypothetical protein
MAFEALLVLVNGVHRFGAIDSKEDHVPQGFSVLQPLSSMFLPPQLGQSLQWRTAGLHHLHHLESPTDRLSYVVIVGRGKVSVGFTLSVPIFATILRSDEDQGAETR